LVERFNKTLCEGIAKVAEVIYDWDKYIQLVLFAYRTKELQISNKSLYILVYGKEPRMVQDKSHGKSTLIERLLEITDRILQLRESARNVIQKSQVQLNEKLQGNPRAFSKGELVWYFDKAKAM
jgi:hypothetical protein